MSEIHGAYSRILVDCHITEGHESFLSRFDPAAYVAAIKRAGVDSAMVYACCHNGNCHYPTRVGHMHRNLKGRDIFGETVRLLRRENILPQAYYTVVYHRHSAIHNPDWRITLADGRQADRRARFSCPNSRGYRAFVSDQVREIAAYDLDGMFVDMTFWPGICICDHCRSRYARESGREIPMTIDWGDPQWVQFQRSRERWLAEFAHEITSAIKNIKPEMAVTHQFAPVLLGWMFGQSTELNQASDTASGDFYGGKRQHRLGAKVLAAFTKTLPYEFMTSRCVTLYDHTSTKSDEELICSAATTLANGGAYLLIDAINPDGTLEKPFYDRLHDVVNALRPFKEKVADLRPVAEADTGLYFSMASQVRRSHSGLGIREITGLANNMLASSDLTPLRELLGTSVVLNHCHAPYRVLTDRTEDFAGLKRIIVNDAAYLSADEARRLREFVRGGGTLIVTGLTSLYDLGGSSTGDFALGDVMGVRFTGNFTAEWNYLVGAEGEKVSCNVPAPLVEATTAQVLARVAQPLFDPDDVEHFASFHSNPPHEPSHHVALSVNRFGKGQCVYLYSSLLAMQQEAQQAFGERLLRRLAPSTIVLQTNAPKSVEITLLRSTTRPSTFLLCLANVQDELPNIPISSLSVTIRLPGAARPTACHAVSDGRTLVPTISGQDLTLEVPRLETIEMIEIDTKENPS